MTTGLASVFSLMRAPFRVFVLVIVGALVATACSSTVETSPQAAATVTSTPHSSADNCGSGFIAHELEHITSGPGNTASTFDGTGAGVGVADLDGDGDLDIVLANLSDTSSVLENTGDLNFTRHELERGRFRGVSLVDVTNDGATDIVLTTGIGPPVLFENPATGDLGAFARTRLDGVRAATYSMAWTDIGGDGDLDLITGSYNAELTLLRNSPILGEDTGVVFHERSADGFTINRLSETAQALALITTDIDGDGQFDVLVGNDLATPDMIWQQDDDEGLMAVDLLSTSSYSTMSLDAADLDNDGRNELFSTDMKPAQTDDRYREVDEDMAAAPVVDDIQTPENVLNDFGDDGFTNMASGQAISTTGWSWSGLFGDLDNDGLQDLYVANGMRSDQLFDFLPDARLVEENQAFRNTGEAFEPASDWGLASPVGGRGMAQADLDGDGDLDIVINNLDAPASLFENTLCGTAITVSLEWLGTNNPDGLGAQVAATAGGTTWTREITSSRGYLSSGPPIAHIGVDNEELVDVFITWPDGHVSTLNDQPTNTHLTISRTPE